MLVKTLFKSNPFDVAREMDRLFDSMIANRASGFEPNPRASFTFPALNLWENDDTVYAEAELPGLSMDDLEVHVTDGELIVKGQRQATNPDQARPLRRERPFGAFERSVQLPVAIDIDRVEARLHDGILSITLPKAEVSKPRRVEVKQLDNAS